MTAKNTNTNAARDAGQQTKFIRRRGAGKIKYWTACVNVYGGRTASGGCYTNLADARAHMHMLNSQNACVVRAGSDGLPTCEVVARYSQPR